MSNSAVPEIFKRAIAAYGSGDLAKAEKLCLATLQSKPDYFDALHLLAVVRSRSGFPADALPIFDKAIALRPNNADLFNNRGSALMELKRFEEALTSYDQALILRPTYADAHNNRGSALMEMERYEDALASYGKALVHSPDNVEFINNLGRALTKLKRYDEAMACFAEALALRPDYFDALVNRGVVLNKLAYFEDALATCDQALALRADNVEALLSRADALNGLTRYEDALLSYARGLELQPERAEILISRGTPLTRLGRFDEALNGYEEALALGVDPIVAQVNRWFTLKEADRLDEALADIDRTIAARPGYPEAHNARGLTLMHMARFDEAIESYRRAIALRPDFSFAEWNIGYLSLLEGNFSGWRGYEARRVQEYARWTQVELRGPEWRGEPLEGKRLLLYSEQGFGDAIQFARFAGVAAAKGAEVILGVRAPLGGLLRNANGVAAIVRHREKIPPYDLHLPLMSMPFVLGLGEKDIPNSPYLHADPDRVATWAKRLPKAPFRVGIAWQGSVGGRRSIPLDAFGPLGRVPGVTFICLQKPSDIEQPVDPPAGMKIEMLGPDFDAGPDAFLDTAAVMMNLDLIVTCDTSIGHLAGALGRPVWIVLKHVPDWRWMMDRTDSPWYPTARLFRRKKDSEWAETMEEVAVELACMVRESASSKSADAAGSSTD